MLQPPSRIRRAGRDIEIEWPDAPACVIAARALRLACPCAACVDEMSGRPILDPATVPDDVRADVLELVGAYAVRIRWSDGHATGIYTFTMLRQQCDGTAAASR